MKLSLCITNYNRTVFVEEAFEQVLNDDRIDEIIICDDNSDLYTCRYLYFLYKSHPKIKVYFHSENVGMYENKKRAISYARNEWCILFDSDNVLTPSYLYAFIENTYRPMNYTIFCPDFAFPKFDYRKYINYYYGIIDTQKTLKEPMFECLLNTCNYVVNKEEYLRIWEPKNDIKAADSIYYMYLWLKAGNSFMVVPNMLYNHRVHDGSGFMEDVKGNMEKAATIKNLILSL